MQSQKLQPHQVVPGFNVRRHGAGPLEPVGDEFVGRPCERAGVEEPLAVDFEPGIARAVERVAVTSAIWSSGSE